MRHVIIDGPGRVRVAETPDPVVPDADGAVVAVEATAICGSDLHFYDGDIPTGDGIAVGHEFIGTVAEVGPDVRRFGVGDRVLIASVAGCGRCDGCATGDPVTCVEGPQVFGSGILARRTGTAVAVPAADFQLLAIPEGMDDEAALLLTDNLATGWIGAKRAEIPPGDTVVVLGLGAVGLCARALALALGAGQRAGRRPGGGPAGLGPSTPGPTRRRARRWRRCWTPPGGGGPTRSSTPWPTKSTLNDALAACGRAARCR